MLSGYLKNRINHLRHSQETQPRQYFTKTLILQGFQAHKNATFGPFLSYFLLILEVPALFYLTKKHKNPYAYYVSELCCFSS